ncbi:hypothetical protein AWB73_01714 [Caballeronia turbans]|jgi:hypothetical protein|uniref:DUF2964 family protein n=1 Tax=unclassified Caballeronia TaxID=2646786 RepID=UPI00074B859C|nr:MULTISPECIES: DUF2964 family protein [unclassified Caballeronia]SAL23812.1 hypothetical protein AWB73_01714 [Caballeronia turbans]
MRLNEPRMVVASIGVFIWLGGLYFTIHGLLYDVKPEFRYGMWALGIGIVTFVVALNPLAQRRSGKRDEST